MNGLLCTVSIIEVQTAILFTLFTVWLKIAKHRKDANLLPMIKKYFAYCFETAYNERPEDEIVLLFDMTNTGISNLVCMHILDPLYICLEKVKQ